MVTGFLLGYWVQVALSICIAASVWLAARAVREHAPHLIGAAPGSETTVEAGDEGLTLHSRGKKQVLRWEEVAAVRVRTTEDGPLAEDLCLEFEGAAGVGDVIVPGGAGGFDGLLRLIGGYLPGFDWDALAEAATRTDRSEAVVWRRA